MKKKILLLGGSAQQVVAIETAKRLGYYTLLCDYLPDNPGQYVADEFFLASTTDMETIFRIAQENCIDGILAYASDPAAPTAAYVAEKLGLPGNPYASVDILCNKDKFRAFLAEHDFCTPKAKGYASIEEAKQDLEKGVFCFPVIVKPVDSSGSKGATILHSEDSVTDALEFALSFSRSHRIVVEEFVEKKHEFLIGGDIFVLGGKVILWGLLNCHRDTMVNPLVPVGKSYPPQLDLSDILEVRKTLQKMVDLLDIDFGAINVELVVDKNNRVYPIDIGPRAGGNMIPDLLGLVFEVDVVEMAVLTAMGKTFNEEMEEGVPFFATYNLHAGSNGTYKKIVFSDELEKTIIKKYLYKKKGDKVEYFDNAAKALGIIFMKFENQADMDYTLHNIEQLYKVILEN